MKVKNFFEFDPRENRFVSQFPSIVVAAAAIVLIVVVNMRAAVAPVEQPARTAPSGQLAPLHHVVGTSNKVSAAAGSDERAPLRI